MTYLEKMAALCAAGFLGVSLSACGLNPEKAGDECNPDNGCPAEEARGAPARRGPGREYILFRSPWNDMSPEAALPGGG